MRIALLSLLAIGVLTGLGRSQFTISETLVNPLGADDGYEAIEIRGPATTKLTGHYILVIEGDNTVAGTVDTVINLGAYTTGTNGLLLVRDSIANTILPRPAAATSVVADAAAFTPDIENGTITMVLGKGTAPVVTTDLDTNNDGKLDNAIPGFTVIDAYSWTDGGSKDHMYAAALGGYEFPNSRAFTPDAVYRIYDASGKPFCWVCADVLSVTVNGPYTFDWQGDDYQGGLSDGFGPQQLDLGNVNGRLQFCADVFGISMSKGGTQTMTLDGGIRNARHVALIIGSLSGTKPGIMLNATVTVPANLDVYTSLLLGAPNTLLTPSVGLLDGTGRMTSKFVLPPAAPVTLGMKFHHAGVIFDSAFSGFSAASNPTTLFIQS